MKTIAIHKGSHSLTKLIKLKNKSFLVTCERSGEIKNNFFTKDEEKQARELFDLLANINY